MHVSTVFIVPVCSSMTCAVICDVPVYHEVKPTPSSWSLDSVREGTAFFSDSVGKLPGPPVPPRPPYSGKLACQNE